MIEVEAKAKIENPEEYRLKAKAIGKYIGKVSKIDDYYSLELQGYPKKSLRVRRLNGVYQVNFKRKISYKDDIFAKNEVEFTTSDIDGFLALINDFGFKKWLRKEKMTELYQINKYFHIELNNVKGLGWFVEVEYLSDLKNISKARNEVLDVLKKMGIDKNAIVKEGYTKLLWNKDRKV